MKTHTFATGKYNIDLNGVDGYCSNPRWENGTSEILLQPQKSDCKFLKIALHEATHAQLEDTLTEMGLSSEQIERIVEDFGERVGLFLWRLGYRRTK